MRLAVELRQVVAGEVVGREGAVEQPLHVVELPVVAEHVVDAEAEVDRVGLLEGVLDDEVILVAHPLVGQVVGVDAEVQPVAPAVGVAGVAVLEPAVDLHRRVAHLEARASGAWRSAAAGAASSSAVTSVGSPPPIARSSAGSDRSGTGVEPVGAGAEDEPPPRRTWAHGAPGLSAVDSRIGRSASAAGSPAWPRRPVRRPSPTKNPPSRPARREHGPHRRVTPTGYRHLPRARMPSSGQRPPARTSSPTALSPAFPVAVFLDSPAFCPPAHVRL